MPSTGLYFPFHTQTNTSTDTVDLSATQRQIAYKFKRKRPRLAVDVAMQERLSMRFAPSCSSSFSC